MSVVVVKFNNDAMARLLDLRDDVVLIRDRRDIAESSVSQELVERCAAYINVSSIDSIEEIADIATQLADRKIHVSKFLSGNEYGVYAKGVLESIVLGDDMASRRSAMCRDRRLTKSILRGLGFFTPRHLANYEAGGSTAGIRFPVVVEPSAIGALHKSPQFNDRHELDSYLNSADQTSVSKSSHWIVEECVTGDEFHLNVIWRSGNPAIVSLVKRSATGLDISSQPTINESSIVDPQEYRSVIQESVQMQKEVNSKLNVTDGVSYARLHRTDDQIAFSEFSFGYLNQHLIEATRLAYGVDFVDEWLRAELGCSSNLPKDYTARYRPIVSHTSSRPNYRTGSYSPMESDHLPAHETFGTVTE